MGHFRSSVEMTSLGSLPGFLDSGRSISSPADGHLQFLPELLGIQHSPLASDHQAPSSPIGDLIGQSVR